ncbi:MAG: hypothetical protein H5U07_01405 [Candidatus Aminicenantes bacterium]|nr:hypothetical protein [Candidatus Aminicenantes bacterium]
MARNSYLVGLDIGTKKTVAIIGEITEEQKVEIIGIGIAESRGIRKGVVVNLEETISAIKRAQEEAELMAGVEIDSAYVGISGFIQRRKPGQFRQHQRFYTASP